MPLAWISPSKNDANTHLGCADERDSLHLVSCSPSEENIVAEKRCWGVPRGCDPLVAGRFMASEKGRQRA